MALRKILLITYPAPVFEGNCPSAIAKATALGDPKLREWRYPSLHFSHNRYWLWFQLL